MFQFLGNDVGGTVTFFSTRKFKKQRQRRSIFWSTNSVKLRSVIKSNRFQSKKIFIFCSSDIFRWRRTENAALRSVQCSRTKQQISSQPLSFLCGIFSIHSKNFTKKSKLSSNGALWKKQRWTNGGSKNQAKTFTFLRAERFLFVFSSSKNTDSFSRKSSSNFCFQPAGNPRKIYGIKKKSAKFFIHNKEFRFQWLRDGLG